MLGSSDPNSPHKPGLTTRPDHGPPRPNRVRDNKIRARRLTPIRHRVTPTPPPPIPSSLPPPPITTVEKKQLKNGDQYTGLVVKGIPHGVGTYTWSDGCVYTGDWSHGKAHGHGKFTWTSGAVYEGDFKSGRMEGTGTFVGSDGDRYVGNWVRDKREGYGERWFRNGDLYEGEWRGGVMDGRGKYVWRNGNVYEGEWKDGVMTGDGVVCDGNNVVDDEDDVIVIDDDDGDDGDGGDGVLFELKGLMVEKEKGLPKICVWEREGEKGDITCDIIDNLEVCMVYKDGKCLRLDDDLSNKNKKKKKETKLYGFGEEEDRKNGEIVSNGDWDFDLREKKKNSPNPRRLFIKEDVEKKPGSTISKGHKNYDLMLNLQLGIRYSVGKHASILRNLKQSDFDPREKFWTRFPPEGSKLTPPHQSSEFRWKDYCPMVFRHLRELFQIDPADYMMAICGSDALRELSSPGKSGSCFYLTQDDRFMIKTVRKSEVKVLVRMLQSYYQHMCRYESSLVTRFYGVHCVKPIGGQKVRFIVMGNLFCSEYRIHKRFDLKGSRYGRSTEKPEGEIDETTTLKDLDLNFVFRLQPSWYQELIKQIERDCEFLEKEKIMDYSLLVGVHFRDNKTGYKMGLSPFLLRSGKCESFRSEKFMRDCRFLEAELQDLDRVLAGRKPLIRLGANMPARAEQLARRSDFDHYTPGGCGNLVLAPSGEISEVVLYFGIIDILQDYDITKKLEHAYKSLQVDSTSISAVDPKLYSKRFRDFVGRIFVEDR